MEEIIFDHPKSGCVSFVGNAYELYRFKVQRDGVFRYATFFDLLTIATDVSTMDDLSFAFAMMDSIQEYICSESEAKMFMNSKWFLLALVRPAISSDDKVEKKTYLVKDKNTGLTKIGRALDPCFREKTLQSEKPTIVLFAVCSRDIENKLHKKFSKKRVRGEWFNLSKNDLDSIIAQYDFLIQDPNF